MEYHDGQDWRTYPRGLGTGFLVHPDGFILTAKHVVPEELLSDPLARSKVRVFGRIGDRSSSELPLRIVDVDPSRDAMLLAFVSGLGRKPLDYFELTDKFTLPILQVSAAGFPASKDGRIRIVTARMTCDLGEGVRTGEVGARLEGGFSGGPVLSGREVLGLVESSSTAGQRETFNFVPIRSIKAWLSKEISFPKPVGGLQHVTLAPPARLALIKHLVDRWNDLAIYLGVPQADVSKWQKGEEPQRLLEWLEQRGRLHQLPPAFKALHYDDLIKYLSDGGASNAGAADSNAPLASIRTPDPDAGPSADRTTTAARDGDPAGKIRDLIEQGLKRPSRNDAIHRLIEGIDEFGLAGRDVKSTDVLEATAFLYSLLSAGYEAGAQFQDAQSAKDREFECLRGVYNKDPTRKIDKRTSSFFRPAILGDTTPWGFRTLSSIGDMICENRLRWAYLVHANRDTVLDPEEQRNVREAIDYARDLVEKSKVTGEIVTDLSVFSVTAYWLNGDLSSACTAIEKAAKGARAPGFPATASLPEVIRYVNCHLLSAAIHAERKEFQAAWESTTKVEPYVRQADRAGVLGYVQLLIARSSSSKDEVLRALDASIVNFNQDQCPSCRYNMACALSAKSRFVEGPERNSLCAERQINSSMF